MHSIRYTVQAEIDLEEMVDYIAQESFANAIEYLERYETRLDLLMRNPQIGTRCENKNIRRDCRVLTFESHLIVYREQSGLEGIRILRIFHHRVDYATKMQKIQGGF
jgi:plasmid stabilization system protein ParE